MSFEILQMPWLPEAPADFKERCRSLIGRSDGLGTELGRLATARLNSSQALGFARTLKRLREQQADLSPLSLLRLAILPSSTIDTIGDMIPAACARHGVAVDLVVAEFDQILQTALDSGAEVFRPKPDAVLLLFDHRWLALDTFEAGQSGDLVKAGLARIAACLRRLREELGTQAIVSTVAVPPGTLFGSVDRAVAGSVRACVHRFNEDLFQLAADEHASVLDVASLAETVGTARWFDPVGWHLYKVPFASSCSALFADWLGRILGAIRGRSRKCLVLDCDNTLWGGVIGDDGLENIVVGPGSGPGESFASVQRLALDLKARGILLAISSKNDDFVARLPFAQHPDMLLRESDIASFQANWIDKPTNLEAVARTLGVGLDSLVLLDDNPAERAQVRAALPMVAVPELPGDPAYYAVYLASAGYFEALTFSDEDRMRVDSYAAGAKRAELIEQVRDLGDYLTALEMTISEKPFDAIGRQRIVQLINKSNQFNLTTRRYTEAEVERFERDPDMFTLQVRLRDKYSDYGMIGVCIAGPREPYESAWEVDTWLMSCRVLGRKVEQAMLNALVSAAMQAGKKTIYARYLKTTKNHMVADLFDRLGFERIEETGEGDVRYRLEVDNFEMAALPHAKETG